MATTTRVQAPSTYINSAPTGGPVLIDSFREIWNYRALIFQLVRRDVKMRYKNSIGGALWSLLSPLTQIAVITVMMQFISAKPIHNYSAYLFIVFLWNFFSVALTDGCVCILGNSSLVRKVYFPRGILPITAILSNLLHFGIAFAFTVLYFFVLGAYPAHLRPACLLVVPVLLGMTMLCLGMTYALSYLNVLYEDIRFITSTLIGLAFYAMPIFYTIEQVKARGLYNLYMLNPVAAYLVTYQRALLPPPPVAGPNGLPLPPVGIPWDFFALALLTSLLVLVGGFALFERYKWEMAERL